MKKCAATTVVAVLLGAVVLKVACAPDGNTIYDPDSNHLWNRLNETLFVRTDQDGKNTSSMNWIFFIGSGRPIYWLGLRINRRFQFSMNLSIRTVND
jgi:hypothetical protein